MTLDSYWCLQERDEIIQGMMYAVRADHLGPCASIFSYYYPLYYWKGFSIFIGRETKDLDQILPAENHLKQKKGYVFFHPVNGTSDWFNYQPNFNLEHQ